MKFADVRQGDTLLTLEQDRRSQFPIFDTAKVQRVGQSSYQRTGTSQSVIQVVQLTLADSTGTFDVTVPLEAEDTIFDKVYITPNPQLIVQEIMVQKSRAQAILSNWDKYKAIDTECDKILAHLAPNSNPNTPQNTQGVVIPSDLIAKVEAQGAMIEKIYKALFREEEPPKES